MRVKFKHKKLIQQWAKLSVINPGLVFIVLYTIDKLGGKGTITHIYRTRKQQKKIYPDKPKKRSVHEFWGGVDTSIRGYKKKRVWQVALIVNTKYPYSKRKGKAKTMFVHDIGLGRHSHFQNRIRIKPKGRKRKSNKQG